ncbi:hypothetical protein DSM104443_02071 [Usitatibacter rugosus]|uniref:Uncharacterized protein n=1 Tax=Usitatibacter rugosus TaxID=2732067 RepID=A0A6M4GUJ0_9PROT|nr:hypothetical protein [Usitatibacter rugosus]QJR11001.1 hypothetical protein DSM104443_02071 [Usitatibacter rugosus]
MVLAEPIAFSDFENSFKHFTRDFVLAAGIYQPAKQDREGTYYHGPRGCLSNVLVGDGKGHRYTEEEKAKWPDPKAAFQKAYFDCGVYVPHDGAKPVYIYIVMNSAQKNVAASAEEIAAMSLVGVSITQSIPQVASASPLTAGLGTGLGMALVTGMMELERGNFMESSWQPRSIDLRSRLKPAPAT